MKTRKTRKNKKKIKKINGGNINNNNNNVNDINLYSDPSERRYLNTYTPNPTIKDNIKKFVDIWIKLFNSIGLYSLEVIDNKVTDISASYGIDMNSTKSIQDELTKVSMKTEKLNEALDTPEGRQALNNLNKLFDNVTNSVIIPSSQKLTDDIIENIQPILIKGQNAVFALLSASPFGAIIDIPRFVSESLGVVEKSVSLIDDVLDVTEETVDGIKQHQDEYNNVKSEFETLIDRANSKVSDTLDSVNNGIDHFNRSAMDLQKKGQMIGGRASKSYLSFIRPTITSAKIVKHNKSKKRYK